MTFTYTGQPGQGFGWGTANTYLSRELRKIFPEEGLDCVMQPLADHDLNASSPLRGRINIGYSFFEYPLGPNAAENAAKYDILFVGSTWCLERLEERGITNGQVLIQGVDHSIFYPRPRQPDGKFKIFSGGKFEYRKGQDLVIAAFREFSKSHPDAHLVCSWFNPWPQLISEVIEKSEYIIPPPPFEITSEEECNRWQEIAFEQILIHNGIPRDRFTVLPQLSHAALAEAMAQTDCGLFPNRCEGGTNLVLMEYASVERTTISNHLTGHADVRNIIGMQIDAKEDERHWAKQDISAIVRRLEDAYTVNFPVHPSVVHEYTWQAAAQTVANAIARLPVAV